MTLGYDAGHLTLTAEVGEHKGPVLAAAWHGGADFSTFNGADTSELTFQMSATGQAPAFTLRGLGGDFVVRRVETVSPS